MINSKEYKIQIDGIDIVEKSLVRTQLSSDDLFLFSVKAQCVVEHQREIVVTLIEVEVTKAGALSVLANVLVAIGFKVTPFQNVFDDQPGLTEELDIKLQNTLKDISISTVRGIMASEYRGTALHNAILPIIVAEGLTPIDKNIIPPK
ncbi:MAG: hypothetical protein ABWZ25_12450 [Chitinophagaceae bacterium]